MPIFRFTKSGSAGEDQGPWQGAKPIEIADKYLQRARPGDAYYFGFDRNREDPFFWSRTLFSLKRSGEPGRPILAEAGFMTHEGGVQLAPLPGGSVFFRQSGHRWAGKARPDTDGQPFLTVQESASHLRIAGFTFVGAPASGFILFGNGGRKGTFSNVLIQHLSATQVGRVVETMSDVHLDSLIVRDCDAYEIVRGFGRFRSISNSRFENLHLDAAGVDGGGERVCQILAFSSGSNVQFENVTTKNAVNALDAEKRGSDYVQGDGIVCERETSDFVFRNCHSVGMGDGGFDIKTNGFLMEHSSARGCKYGLRIWAQADNTVRYCAFENPRTYGDVMGASVWVGGRADIVDSRLQAGPGTSAFRFWETEGTPHVRMFGGQIDLDSDAELAMGSGTLELHDVAVNGELRNETVQSSDGFWGRLR